MSEIDISSIPAANIPQEKQKYHVRFPEAVEELSTVACEIPNREDLTEEDNEALWFSSDDYQAIKMDARVLGLESERIGCSKVLDDEFKEKTKEAQSKLYDWVSNSPERRGLERLCNTEHGSLRQQEQFKLIMDVLRAQDDMLCSRRRKVDAEELRKVSCKVSRAARHFARMIGKADAKEADKELGVSRNHHDHESTKALKDKKHTSEKNRAHLSEEKEDGDGHNKNENEQEQNKLRLFGRAYKDTKQMYKDTKAGIAARFPRIA